MSFLGRSGSAEGECKSVLGGGRGGAGRSSFLPFLFARGGGVTGRDRA